MVLGCSLWMFGARWTWQVFGNASKRERGRDEHAVAIFAICVHATHRCKNNNKSKCYHWDVGDEDSVAKFQDELRLQMQEYLEVCGHSIDEVKLQSKIVLSPSSLDRETYMRNIVFVPKTDTEDYLEQMYFFSSLVSNALQLRGMPIDGSLTERRDCLRQRLLVEEKICLIRTAISRSELGRESALILIKQAIICIMHLENCVSEKNLTMLLSIGAELYQGRRAQESLKGYNSSVEDIVSKQILGTHWRPKQWRVPMKEGGLELSSVSLSNSKTRTFMTALEPLISFIFNHPDDHAMKMNWMKLLSFYNPAMELLRQPTDFTDDEIETFQEGIDRFYKKWISLVGREGITNYIHMLGSGHVAHYLTQHRYLYKFSQQNWESLNEKMKLIFFRNTQRGVNYGRHTPENARVYLLSLLKVFQRELLWLSGIGDEMLTHEN